MYMYVCVYIYISMCVYIYMYISVGQHLWKGSHGASWKASLQKYQEYQKEQNNLKKESQIQFTLTF